MFPPGEHGARGDASKNLPSGLIDQAERMLEALSLHFRSSLVN
jgi:hypothetical protein